LLSDNSHFVRAAFFNDINIHWAREYIEDFASKGYISGYSDGNFMPDRAITRGEVSVILAQLNLPETEAVQTFSDVDKYSIWYETVQKAQAVGAVAGYGDGNFFPEDNISREEAIKVTAVSAEKLSGFTPGTSNVVLPFSDKDELSDWSKEYAKILFQYGTLIGYPDGSIRSGANVTRAEFVKLFSDVIEKISLETINISGTLTGSAPKSGVTVRYLLNDSESTAVTENSGAYEVTVTPGSGLVIYAPSISGYNVTPSKYTLTDIVTNLANMNFNYTSTGGGG
jgi:hypothetical protein